DRTDARISDKFLETEIRIVRRHDVVCRVAAARRVADCSVENKSAATAGVLDLVSAAYRRFALAAPRHAPCEADGRTEIVQIAIVDRLSGVRRVRANIDDLHQVAANSRFHPVVEAVAG